MELTTDRLSIKHKIHKFCRKKLIAKIFIWLAAEILLSFLGLDDVADYSEFIYEKPITTLLA